MALNRNDTRHPFPTIVQVFFFSYVVSIVIGRVEIEKYFKRLVEVMSAMFIRDFFYFICKLINIFFVESIDKRFFE